MKHFADEPYTARPRRGADEAASSKSRTYHSNQRNFTTLFTP